MDEHFVFWNGLNDLGTWLNDLFQKIVNSLGSRGWTRRVHGLQMWTVNLKFKTERREFSCDTLVCGQPHPARDHHMIPVNLPY